MKIQIRNFFISERNDEKEILRGTLHIYLIDEQINIRGCFVCKKKDKWYFKFPERIGRDKITGEKYRYPVVNFEDPEKRLSILEEMKVNGIKYILENFFA